MTTEQVERSPSSEPGEDEIREIARQVAPGTHPVELARLARERSQHPGCDPLATQVLLWVVRASSALLAAQAETLRDADLSPSAFNVLMALRNTPGGVLEPCDIAERLLVTRPSVTGLLDTLESKGLVERGAHPADRRRRLVRLTDQAHDVLSANLGRHYAALDELLADLGADERRSLVGLLRRIDGTTPAALRDDPDALPSAAEPPRSDPLDQRTGVTAAG